MWIKRVIYVDFIFITFYILTYILLIYIYYFSSNYIRVYICFRSTTFIHSFNLYLEYAFYKMTNFDHIVCECVDFPHGDFGVLNICHPVLGARCDLSRRVGQS